MDELATADLGPRAAAITLLQVHYGEELGGWLLLNRTCFPDDAEAEWEQVKAMVRDGIPRDQLDVARTSIAAAKLRALE